MILCNITDTENMFFFMSTNRRAKREEREGGLRGRLVFQADVLDRPMVEAMAVQYGLVIRAASMSVENNQGKEL